MGATGWDALIDDHLSKCHKIWWQVSWEDSIRHSLFLLWVSITMLGPLCIGSRAFPATGLYDDVVSKLDRLYLSVVLRKQGTWRLDAV